MPELIDAYTVPLTPYLEAADLVCWRPIRSPCTRPGRGTKPASSPSSPRIGAKGPHPFTIATVWDPTDRKIGFIAKELGDHTARLRDHFVHGRPVRIEGPYGRFAFDDGKPHPIWVGADIGITPFVAKMRELAKTPNDTRVDLFHATSDVSEVALAKMRADAAAANVNLHIFVSGRDGKIDAGKILAIAPNWRDASVWFCGPARFGAALKRGLRDCTSLISIRSFLSCGEQAWGLDFARRPRLLLTFRRLLVHTPAARLIGRWRTHSRYRGAAT
jgi:hypothetical protein